MPVRTCLIINFLYHLSLVSLHLSDINCYYFIHYIYFISSYRSKARIMPPLYQELNKQTTTKIPGPASSLAQFRKILKDMVNFK